MRIVLAALSFALSFAVAPGGEALGQATSAVPPASDSIKLLKMPMVFYVARGEPDICGPGCNEWIAAEGEFDAGAVARFRAFLVKTRAAKLPIYIHSSGGLTERASDIGRFIRHRGMTVGVSKTVPEECKVLDEKSCNALKRSGKTLIAELSPLGACASACVYVLAAGKIRQVPPGARVGVHLSQTVRLHADGRITVAPKASQVKIGANDARQRKYLSEMGVDSRLMDIASKIPHESVYFLSRDEIANLRIDAREFQETGWIVMPSKPISVRKFFVEAKGPERKEFRLGVVGLSCSIAGHTQLIYLRGLASNEGGRAQAVGLVVDGKEIPLAGVLSATTLNSLDAGVSFDRWGTLYAEEFLKQVAKAENFAIAVGAVGRPLQTGGATQLSTAGLSRAVATMREKCGGAAVYSGAAAPKP